jgi:putative transposase
MKGTSKASKTKQGKDFTMSSPISAVQRELPLFATAELVQPSSETTSPDKLNLWSSNIQTPKSSKISAHDSTLKGKDCKPYWSDLCGAISSQLLLRVATDCAGSDLNYSSSWQSKTVEKSWFLIELSTVQKPNSQRILWPSFTSLALEYTDSEVTARKSRKLRLFLNAEQKSLIKQWLGVSRFVYRTTIKYLQEPGTKAKWMAITTGILNSLSEWAKSVPFPIKSIAIKDACSAFKAAKQGFKKDGQIRKGRFRSRKNTKQSIYVPKSVIKDCGVYRSILGKCRLAYG